MTKKRNYVRKLQIFGVFSLLLIFVCACNLNKNDSSNENSVPQKTIEENGMRINLGKISLMIPKGFADNGIYVFRNKDETNSVMVSRENFSPDENFPKVVKEQKEKLSTSFFGLFQTILKEGETTLAGLPAYEFIVKTPHGGGLGYSHIVLANDSAANSYVRLALDSANSDPVAQEEFAHIIKSAALTRNEQDGKTDLQPAKDFSRRYAGALTLDIPVEYPRLQTFNFEKKTTADPRHPIKLTLRIFEKGEPAPESLEAELENLRGSVKLHDSQESVTSEYKIKVQRYTGIFEKLGLPPRQYPLMMADIQLNEGSIIRIKGTAHTMPPAGEMKTGFDELVNSIRSNKEK